MKAMRKKLNIHDSRWHFHGHPGICKTYPRVGSFELTPRRRPRIPQAVNNAECQKYRDVSQILPNQIKATNDDILRIRDQRVRPGPDSFGGSAAGLRRCQGVRLLGRDRAAQISLFAERVQERLDHGCGRCAFPETGRTGGIEGRNRHQEAVYTLLICFKGITIGR